MDTKAVHRPFFFSVGGGKRREEPPFGSPETVETLSIFTIFPVKLRKRYQSHFEALGLHLFVRDAERRSDDCANSSNPTYSRSSHKTHTHSRASAAFPSFCVPTKFSCGVSNVELAASAAQSPK